MQINTIGVTRTVLILRTVVIKIPCFHKGWCNFLRGLVGNMNEANTWRWNSGKYDRGYSHLLCPVVWSSWGGWLLIMKKARTITEDQYWNVYHPQTVEHEKHFGGDDSAKNYGIFQQNIVKIDYADLDNHWGEDFKITYNGKK